jgi:hypothetical protein|nr:MAG TPA: hypothetical protein [Caudoviricetes sp.]
MEVVIKAEAKEIADLVLALQGQRWNGEIELKLDPKALAKAIHDMHL